MYVLLSLWYSFYRWLDSSKTLFEQEVKEADLLYLRFKYYTFMDIDTRVCVSVCLCVCVCLCTLLYVSVCLCLCVSVCVYHNYKFYPTIVIIIFFLKYDYYIPEVSCVILTTGISLP